MTFKKLNLDVVITVIALGMSIYHLIHTQYMLMGPIEHQNLHYMFALTLAFLFQMKKNPSTVKRTILFVLIVLSLTATTYIFLNFSELQEMRGPLYRLNIFDLIVGVILILVGLEATRRSFGFVFPLVALIFMLYAYFGHYLKGPLHTSSIPFKELITVYGMGLQGGMYGTVLGISANYIFLFVLFGGVLGVTGASRFFTQIGSLIARRMAGGPAITATVSSALMGSITGSALANVATTGAFTIPMMKKVGYKSYQAGALEAAASTGGQIMPPVMGATAFIMAEMVEQPYVRIMIAAAIPAILYFLSVGLYAQLQAKRMKIDAAAAVESVRFRDLLSDSPIFIFPLVMIIVLLLLRYSPMFTIFWALVVLLIANFGQVIIRKEKGSLKRLISGFVNGATSGANIAVTCAVIGPIITTVTKTALGIKIPSTIALWSGGHISLALIITMFACIILGMGVPTMPAYVLVSLVGAPVVIKLGVPMLSAHMFVFIFAVFSLLTPPIGVSAVPAAGIAGASYLRTAFEASKVGLVGFLVPYLVVFSPELLLEHASIRQILLTVACSVGAILTLGPAVVGYAFGDLKLHERFIFGLVAVFLFATVVVDNNMLSLAALVAFAALIFWQRYKIKSVAGGGVYEKTPVS